MNEITPKDLEKSQVTALFEEILPNITPNTPNSEIQTKTKTNKNKKNPGNLYFFTQEIFKS